jgi:hypothetical protein
MAKKQREAPEIEAMMIRMFNALGKRCEQGELEALEALDRLNDEAHSALTLGVLFYRLSPAQPSWASIADTLGITRQAAHKRFAFVEQIERSIREGQERCKHEAVLTGPQHVECVDCGLVLS